MHHLYLSRVPLVYSYTKRLLSEKQTLLQSSPLYFNANYILASLCLYVNMGFLLICLYPIGFLPRFTLLPIVEWLTIVFLCFKCLASSLKDLLPLDKSYFIFFTYYLLNFYGLPSVFLGFYVTVPSSLFFHL